MQNSKRRQMLTLVALVTFIILVVWGLYTLLYGRFYQTTDDAYTDGNRISVAAQVSGTIVAVNTDDTQYVKKGQLLIQLDPTDAELALDQSKAALANTIRAVSGQFHTVDADSAQARAAAATLVQATEDLKRAKGLYRSGNMPRSGLDHAQAAYDTAQADLLHAQSQLHADAARVAGTSVETNPQVKLAETQLRTAWVNLQRTRIVAPAAGYVTQKNAQPGDQVTPSVSLLTIVPMDQVWADANYKETELRNIRLGQPAEVTSDLYGSGVVYHGTVAGLDAGTGSAFALLPPQNASGNWIKVVQRLPVRVNLDATELAAHPLPLGVSLDVRADTHERSGKRLSQVPAWQASFTTDVYESQLKGADVLIAQIMAANLPETQATGR